MCEPPQRPCAHPRSERCLTLRKLQVSFTRCQDSDTYRSRGAIHHGHHATHLSRVASDVGQSRLLHNRLTRSRRRWSQVTRPLLDRGQALNVRLVNLRDALAQRSSSRRPLLSYQPEVTPAGEHRQGKCAELCLEIYGSRKHAVGCGCCYSE